MSTAAAAADAASPPAKAGKKKLIIIIVAALVLVLGGGGAAFMLLKKPHDAEEGEAGDGHGKSKAKAKHKEEPQVAQQQPGFDPKHPPVFVPMDAFTVNLADKDSERYAQIGVTLEIDTAATGEQLKLVMPAIRNNILMVLSHKTSAQLLTLEGKEKLARAILYASVRPLGYQVDDDEDEEEADAAPKKKKKRRPANMVFPVRGVHFSNFIVQ